MPPAFDLLIVGGGASGTAVIRALASARSADPAAAPIRVALVERTARLGPGLPYGETADPLHTMGRTATLRREKGLQLERRYTAAALKLRQSGASLEVLTGVEASALHREGQGWVLELPGVQLRAPQVVLASGHWHVARLGHLQRWVDWRWDVRALHAGISDEEDVVVVGMGQSGLDVALALGERRRGLARAGRIQLVSRTGLLPSVFGQVVTANAARATAHLRALVQAPRVSLGDVVEAAHADAEAMAAGTGMRVPAWDLSSLRAHAAAPEPVSLFRGELAAAMRSRQARQEIPWHPVLWHGMHFFYQLLPRLCAEDRLLLAAWWVPVMRHVEAIHVGAAGRLLELLDQGRISVTALGEAPRFVEDAQGITVVGSRAEVRGHRLVDTRGPDPRLHLSDDRFLHSVLATGSAAAGRVAFEQRPPASGVPEGWSVEHSEGRDWLVTGGLWVDPGSYQVRDPRGETHGLWALGPLTLGQFPFYAGLWATGFAAERIVASGAGRGQVAGGQVGSAN